MTHTPLTAAQVTALSALIEANRARPGAFHSATALGVSGATLAALVRAGLAKSGATWRSDLFKEVGTYQISTNGRIALRRASR